MTSQAMRWNLAENSWTSNSNPRLEHVSLGDAALERYVSSTGSHVYDKTYLYFDAKGSFLGYSRSYMM